MASRYLSGSVAFFVLTISWPLYAADPARGQELNRQCSVCHGKLGLAKDPEVPNLAGQSAYYIEKSLKDYQSGVREDRRMTLLVKNLTDQDIKDLAAWFESIEVIVKEPKSELSDTEQPKQ